MAHLTNFSFEFFYEIFTEDASPLVLYHGAKKSKMTKNSNQGRSFLKRSESFKACFELYQSLNPEKSFKLNWGLKNDFWAFFHDFCSAMFTVVAWVQVEFRSLSSFRRCMLFDWMLLLLLLSKFTFSRDCVQGWWVPSSKVCFFCNGRLH